LERERDDLQKKLDTAVKELAGRKSKAAAARVQEMTAQLTSLRARLEVLEARQVPYAADELALLKAPAARLAPAAPLATRKPVRELPAGTVALVAEAQRSFAARQYDKAEEKYLQVLRQDDRNIITLANLAVIQMELNRLDEAEKHARQAVTLASDDAYSHSVLGQIKLRQQKSDEALDELSHAAQLNPQSAEIQNFLGIALSHKGLRGPAETALRKAIQLEPGYGTAHNNLAVIYLNQNPPMVELARWHYQKALAAGHPQNPELEKALNAKEAPANTQ
jgi:tetratricopeptide (TPR) repeat protein